MWTILQPCRLVAPLDGGDDLGHLVLIYFNVFIIHVSRIVISLFMDSVLKRARASIINPTIKFKGAQAMASVAVLAPGMVNKYSNPIPFLVNTYYHISFCNHLNKPKLFYTPYIFRNIPLILLTFGLDTYTSINSNLIRISNYVLLLIYMVLLYLNNIN